MIYKDPGEKAGGGCWSRDYHFTPRRGHKDGQRSPPDR